MSLPPIGARLLGAMQAGRLLGGGTGLPAGGIVLAYHDVGDDPENHTDYYVSSRRFREQLQWAVSFGLRIIDLAELSSRWLAGQSIDGLGAVVFDDSLVGVHHHAMPILLELGLPATVFTVSDALGETPPWWSGAARVMTEREALEMHAAGFRLASHTRTHASLPTLRGSGLIDEIAGSRQQLEDLAGAPVDILAYPYGHHDDAVRDATREAGYRVAYTFLNGRVTPGLDPLKLPRLNMWEGQTRARLAYHLARSSSSWPDHQADDVGPADT